MLTTQKVHLAIIIMPAVVLALAIILMNKNVGWWLVRYGLIVAIPGLFLAVAFGKQPLDVMLLIDTGGFGRAYVAGSMLLLAGVIVQCWISIKRLIKGSNRQA